MSDTVVVLLPDLTRRHVLVGWMLGAFLLTFLVTRAITHAIRRGRGPFRNTQLGGVHIHHQVYGIFLLLAVGTLEFTYRPAEPWADVLAALFGAGAALTLDEFALWLRLDDVYWTREGRSSVDAVLVASVIGVLLLVGANPLGAEPGDGAVGLAVTIGCNLACALIAVLKGRAVLGVLGVLIPLVALVAAVRLAHPGSPWARWRYDERKLTRARRRFPPGRRGRWDRLVDLFASVPEASAPSRSR